MPVVSKCEIQITLPVGWMNFKMAVNYSGPVARGEKTVETGQYKGNLPFSARLPDELASPLGFTHVYAAREVDIEPEIKRLAKTLEATEVEIERMLAVRYERGWNSGYQAWRPRKAGFNIEVSVVERTTSRAGGKVDVKYRPIVIESDGTEVVMDEYIYVEKKRLVKYTKERYDRLIAISDSLDKIAERASESMSGDNLIDMLDSPDGPLLLGGIE